MSLVPGPSRKQIETAWTPGLILGVFCYLIGLLLLHRIGEQTGLNTVPCLIRQAVGMKCPLCGGTSASIALLNGNPGEALALNPLVTISVIVGSVWFLLKAVFKTKLRLPLSPPLLVCCITLLVAINWIYVVNRTAVESDLRPLAARYLIQQWMQE